MPTHPQSSNVLNIDELRFCSDVRMAYMKFCKDYPSVDIKQIKWIPDLSDTPETRYEEAVAIAAMAMYAALNSET